MKKIFLLLAVVGMIFTACGPANGLDEDNNGNNGNNTEQPGGGNQGGGDNPDNPGGGDQGGEEIPADKTQAIKFQDENTKLLCTFHWDENEDGELSYEEAAAVTDLGTAFKGFSILAFTELKYFTSLEKIADSAFVGCVSLVKITLPEQITTIGTSAFNGCTNLKKIAIPNAVTEIGGKAFNGCTSLTRVDISDLSVWCKISFGDDANPLDNRAELYVNGVVATEITIPSDIVEVKKDAFIGCSSLTKVTIPNGVTLIGNAAFCRCPSLTSVTIPDSVTTIGDYAFRGCTSLTSVTIPDSVTSIGGWTFSGCSSLTNVTIGDSVTSIGGYAFYDCRSLTSVTIPDSVTSIGGRAFSGCSSLTNVTIGDSVTSIGDYAFYDCDITDTYVNIGDLAAYATNNNTHRFPSSNKHLLVDGVEITELVIPDSVTTIGGNAFSNCHSLTSVTIPDSVTWIGVHAFSGCSSLTSIYCKPIVKPDVSVNSFDTACLKVIYVPRDSYRDYIYKGTGTFGSDTVNKLAWGHVYKSYIQPYDFE